MNNICKNQLITKLLLNNSYYQSSVYFKVGYKSFKFNGPATICDSGNKKWFGSRKLHNSDGPVFIFKNGEKEWFVNGKFIKKVI